MGRWKGAAEQAANVAEAARARADHLGAESSRMHALVSGQGFALCQGVLVMDAYERAAKLLGLRRDC